MTLIGLILLFTAHVAADQPEPPLFDGETFDGWTMSDGKPITHGWEVVDGMIHLKKEGKRAGHIITARSFGDFRLSFEWAIAERRPLSARSRPVYLQLQTWTQAPRMAAFDPMRTFRGPIDSLSNGTYYHHLDEVIGVGGH